MTQEDEQREQFIDAMYNYFGIEEEGELKYFGDIFDSVFLPFVQSNFISKASVREAINEERDLFFSDEVPTSLPDYIERTVAIRASLRKEILETLGLSEEGKKDA